MMILRLFYETVLSYIQGNTTHPPVDRSCKQVYFDFHVLKHSLSDSSYQWTLLRGTLLLTVS